MTDTQAPDTETWTKGIYVGKVMVAGISFDRYMYDLGGFLVELPEAKGDAILRLKDEAGEAQDSYARGFTKGLEVGRMETETGREVQRLRTALEKHMYDRQWQGYDYCIGCKNARGEGHVVGCDVAAALEASSERIDQ